MLSFVPDEAVFAKPHKAVKNSCVRLRTQKTVTRS